MKLIINWYDNKEFYYLIIYQTRNESEVEITEGIWRSYKEQYLK